MWIVVLHIPSAVALSNYFVGVTQRRKNNCASVRRGASALAGGCTMCEELGVNRSDASS